MSKHPQWSHLTSLICASLCQPSVRATGLALLLAGAAACGSDSSGPDGRCLAGVDGLELRIVPTAGAGPRFEWASDGCVAVGLFVQDLEGAAGTTWAIRLEDQSWGARPGLPAAITYGVVPSGAVQVEPSEGPALALVSGREYLVMLTTRAGDRGYFNSWPVQFVQP